MIKAKAVSDKFWILKDGNLKIGEVNGTQQGYRLNIKGKQSLFQTIDALKIKTGIDFSNKITKRYTEQNTVHGFPVSKKPYNAMWDIKNKLPLYTTKEDSKSWFAAGYYLVNIKGKWKTILSPKLIILERNDYSGPFKTSPSYDSY